MNERWVIKMNKEDIWQLFKLTGKVEYYMKYKKMREKEK
jgi:hypothetical protein